MATIDPLTGLPTSNTPQAISASSLAPQTPIVVPPTPQNTTDYTGIQTGVTSQIANEYQSLQKQLDQAQAQQNQAGQSQLDIMGLLGGKTADLQTAQEQTGVNTETANLTKYAEQLANLNAQASSLQREAQAIPIQSQLNYQGTAGTQSGVQSVNRDLLSQNALKALSIGQQADIAAAAATGSQLRLQAAKDKAQQIVDLKYKPLEDQLAIKKQQYELNKDVLSQIDKKRTEALNLSIQKETEALAEKKANDKEVSKLIVEASQFAPSDILARARSIQEQGGSATQVAMALGQYGKDYLANEKLKLDMQKVKQSMVTETLQQQKLRGEINAQNPTTITGAGSNAEAWLAQYNSGALSLEDIYTKIGSTKEAGVLKNQVAQLVAAQGGKRVYGKDDASIQAINSQIKNIDDLLKGDVGTIVGLVQGGLGILPDKANIYKQDALAVAKNLISNQTLQALADAKSKGVTFGALSEAELKAVADSASRISAKIKTDDKGNITGFTGSESQFKKDLQAVKEGLQKSIINKTQSTSFVSTGNPVADSFVQKSMGVLQSANTSSPATMGGFIDNQK